jgi:hypothetical protein
MFVGLLIGGAFHSCFLLAIRAVGCAAFES